MKRIIRTMNIKKYLYSEANIFHAIYSIKESIQEKIFWIQMIRMTYWNYSTFLMKIKYRKKYKKSGQC